MGGGFAPVLGEFWVLGFGRWLVLVLLRCFASFGVRLFSGFCGCYVAGFESCLLFGLMGFGILMGLGGVSEVRLASGL